MIKLKSIKVPRNLLLDARRMARAVDNALDGAAKAAKVDLDTTTQSWKERPTFTIEQRTSERIVATDDQVYAWVDEGTPAHVIVPRGKKPLAFGVPSRAKTRPRVIGSTKGSPGNTPVFTRRVKHPGTEAREFTTTVAKKWNDELPVVMQRAIDAEI